MFKKLIPGIGGVVTALCAAALIRYYKEAPYYKQSINLPRNTWLLANTPTFQFSIKNTLRPYQLLLEITHSQSYPYQNLFLSYCIRNLETGFEKSELLNFPLSDSKTGIPYGKGYGSTKTERFCLIDTIQFPSQGSYTCTLTQFMRKDALDGIHRLQLKIY